MAKPGDWYCGCCKELIFGSKDKCRKCNYKKGDWKCPTCKGHIFASKDKCNKCSTEPNCVMCKKQDVVLLNIGNKTICTTCYIEVCPTEQTDNTCVICSDRKKDILLTKCKHLCMCNICYLAINKCPMCRVGYNPDSVL